MSSNREEALFEAALELDSEAKRKEYLNLACGPNQVLRERLKARLEVYQKADSYFRIEGTGTANSPPETALAADTASIEGLGTMIGRYRLILKTPP